MSCQRAPVTRPITFAIGLLLVVTNLVRAQSATPTEAQSKENSHRWAILIGVDDYAQLNDLEFCGADQRALRDQLIAAGFPDKQIFLLHDKAEDKKYQPFKANVEKQLALVLGLVEQGDTVIVAFSGHGVQSGKTPYLCPTEAVLNDPTSMVSLDWVYEQLRDCPATLRLLLVDACRNDPRLGSPRGTTPSDETRKLAKSLEQPPPEGILLLTSCSAGEISMEEKTFGHGVFMHYMLEGLKGAADADMNGRVSLGELSNFAGSETKLYVARKFNESQRPKLRGDLTIEALGFELSDVALPKEYVSKSTGMKLVLIPAGEFAMGSAATEAERGEDEGPRHNVRISQPFYMGAYELTQGEYESVMGTNPSEFSKTSRYKHMVVGQNTSRFPVDRVSWKSAVEFCQKLSAKDGVTYRLPTEAEWEYACRAGTTTPFHFGNFLNGDKANVDGNHPYGTSAKGKYLNRTTTVGSYAQNGFGLFDMHGNVAEWCQDVYDAKVYGNRSGTTVDPLVTSGSESRVFRGGSWWGFSSVTRSTYRGSYFPYIPNDYVSVGFRVVISSAAVRTP